MVGDFADCAYGVLKDRCSLQPRLSVMDVVNRLNDIANGYSSSDKSLVRSTLEHLIKNLTGLENKWFIRILTKENKLGTSSQLSGLRSCICVPVSMFGYL